MSTPDVVPHPQPTAFTRFLLPALVRPSTYWFMALVILLLDFLTGPILMFPILFVIPVTLAAWFLGFRPALTLAILLPLGRFCIASIWESSAPLGYISVNGLIRVAVLAFIAYLVSRTARQTGELQREVKLLEGMLPICSFCKKIRDERNDWKQIETYISTRTDAEFTHSVCPECAQLHYGDILNKTPKA